MNKKIGIIAIIVILVLGSIGVVRFFTKEDQKTTLTVVEKKWIEDNKKDGKFKAFIKKHKKLSIFIGLILLFTLSLGGTMLALNLTNPAEVDMPNVVGLSQDEAKQDIEEAKLVFEVAGEEYNKDVPEGFVISQKAEDDLGDFTTTPQNKKVKEGSKVLVKISKGQEKTTVPNVEGKEKEEAIKMLEDAKLQVEVIEETSKTVKEGYVISQETEPDSEAFAGDTVKIHVSTGTGIKQVTVISVIGQDEATAKSNLENLGLKVNVTYKEATSNNGKVTAQSIDANKTVDEGTTITITVNQVAEDKTVNATIDVKAITGGYEENSEGEDGKNVVKTVNIEIKVGDNTVYTDSNVDKNTTNKSASISGRGSQRVTLTITDSNGGNWTRTQTVNFDSSSSISFK